MVAIETAHEIDSRFTPSPEVTSRTSAACPHLGMFRGPFQLKVDKMGINPTRLFRFQGGIDGFMDSNATSWSLSSLASLDIGFIRRDPVNLRTDVGENGLSQRIQEQEVGHSIAPLHRPTRDTHDSGYQLAQAKIARLLLTPRVRHRARSSRQQQQHAVCRLLQGS